MKLIYSLLILLAACFGIAQETGVIVKKELSVIYPVEIIREGRVSLKGFGGLTVNTGIIQGGAILSYSVKRYEVGLAGRFLSGRPADIGLYVGMRF